MLKFRNDLKSKIKFKLILNFITQSLQCLTINKLIIIKYIRRFTSKFNYITLNDNKVSY